MSRYALGNPNALFNVYVEKAPPFEDVTGFPPIEHTFYPLNHGDINRLGDVGGNGWRKVFNVYAKWLFAYSELGMPSFISNITWQSYRDERLLQAESDTALLFGGWELVKRAEKSGVHIIAGRTHANKLGIAKQCVWIDKDFALHSNLPIVVCPYFDYRQLSNEKIDVLNRLIVSMTDRESDPFSQRQRNSVAYI